MRDENRMFSFWNDKHVLELAKSGNVLLAIGSNDFTGVSLLIVCKIAYAICSLMLGMTLS